MEKSWKETLNSGSFHCQDQLFLKREKTQGISSEGIDMSSVEHSTKQISIQALELFILAQWLKKKA